MLSGGVQHPAYGVVDLIGMAGLLQLDGVTRSLSQLAMNARSMCWQEAMVYHNATYSHV